MEAQNTFSDILARVCAQQLGLLEEAPELLWSTSYSDTMCHSVRVSDCCSVGWYDDHVTNAFRLELSKREEQELYNACVSWRVSTLKCRCAFVIPVI